MDTNNRIIRYCDRSQESSPGGLDCYRQGRPGPRPPAARPTRPGQLTVPAVTVSERHTAYIYGYTDGTFGPENNMTRSEAAAIFARILADKNGDTLTTAAKTKVCGHPRKRMVQRLCEIPRQF